MYSIERVDPGGVDVVEGRASDEMTTGAFPVRDSMVRDDRVVLVPLSCAVQALGTHSAARNAYGVMRCIETVGFVSNLR